MEIHGANVRAISKQSPEEWAQVSGLPPWHGLSRYLGGQPSIRVLDLNRGTDRNRAGNDGEGDGELARKAPHAGDLACGRLFRS
jgi:hypothetical protein